MTKMKPETLAERLVKRHIGAKIWILIADGLPNGIRIEKRRIVK